MLCKLIRPGESVAVTTAPWQPRGGTGVPARFLAHAPQSAPNAAENQAAAQAEVEARVKAAYQQGHAAGEAAGAQRAAQRMEPAIASLNSVVQELAGMRKRVRMEAEESAVNWRSPSRAALFTVNSPPTPKRFWDW